MIRRWLQEGNPRQRITELEAQVTQLTEENTKLLDLLAEANRALDALQEELDKVQTREKAAAEQRKIVQEHLDVLSSRKPRTSKAKPPEKEI